MINKIYLVKIFNSCQTGSTADVTTPKRYNPNFHIFLQWSRDKCGLEFLNAIEDGSIRFDAMDQYDGIQLKNEFSTLSETLQIFIFSIQYT